MSEKKDNSTLQYKVSLRMKLLGHISDPVIMETHGGFGDVYRKCYSNLLSGIVLEKDPKKASALARQRPTWMVYECDSLSAIQGGIANLIQVNFLDVDPYGDPWNILEAFF